MNKRGQSKSTVTVLMEAILLSVVIILMLSVIRKEILSTKYDKMFLARDHAMLIDTIHASPNKILLNYPQDITGFSFKYEDSTVIVYREDEGEVASESYPFTEDPNLPFEQKTLVYGEEDTQKSILYLNDKNSITPIHGIFVEDLE